jgi:hypothetical protein
MEAGAKYLMSMTLLLLPAFQLLPSARRKARLPNATELSKLLSCSIGSIILF